MKSLRRAVLGAVFSLLWLVACGGGTGFSGSDAIPVPSPSSLTLTLDGTGVKPKASSISASGSIIAVNGDSAAHQLLSTPDQEQMDCPELNSPMLAPGDEFTATIAARNGTCGFSDSLNPNDSNFHGTVTVTTVASGPSGDGSGGYGY